MAIFQNTVVNKYLKNQEAQVLSEKWTLFKSHFLDPAKQDNIRNAKAICEYGTINEVPLYNALTNV